MGLLYLDTTAPAFCKKHTTSLKKYTKSGELLAINTEIVYNIHIQQKRSIVLL